MYVLFVVFPGDGKRLLLNRAVVFHPSVLTPSFLGSAERLALDDLSMLRLPLRLEEADISPKGIIRLDDFAASGSILVYLPI